MILFYIRCRTLMCAKYGPLFGIYKAIASLTPYATSWDIVIHDFLALHRKMVQNI